MKFIGKWRRGGKATIPLVDASELLDGRRGGRLLSEQNRRHWLLTSRTGSCSENCLGCHSPFSYESLTLTLVQLPGIVCSCCNRQHTGSKWMRHSGDGRAESGKDMGRRMAWDRLHMSQADCMASGGQSQPVLSAAI